MLVNTIEFNGEKAVINSYSSAYVREYGMTKVVRLVSEGRAKGDHLYSQCHAVGKLSEAV